MPASVVPISGRRQGTYVLLEAALPGRPPRQHRRLADRSGDRIAAGCGCASATTISADPEDAEVLEALEADIRERLAEIGRRSRGSHRMEDSLSNVVRVSERQAVAVDAFSRVLDRLFDEHVEKRSRSSPSARTCRCTACAPPPAGWARKWNRRKRIGCARRRACGSRPICSWPTWWAGPWSRAFPDGSLNLFRLHPVGSRQDKILLIQRFGVLDETARYTVKRYTSRKVSKPARDQWRHERIRLEPLNPEFEAWDVGPEDFAVVAEWLRVIE